MEIHTLVLGYLATNTYILIDNDAAIVIDPADNAEQIYDFISNKHATLKYILLTHAHFDHIGAVHALQCQGASVVMSGIDHGIINSSGVFYVHEEFDLDIAVSDDEELDLIGHKFKVIATPGHTPGSVCYIMDGNKLFSGDTLFYDGIGRSDFTLGNADDLNMSVKRLFALSPEITVFPGHGNTTTIEHERICNPYAKT